MDFCGMEGTTGIIVGAKLKVFNLIERSASIFQSDSLDEIFSIARRLKLEKEVTMLKFLSEQVSKILNFPERYHLIIEFNSQRGKIKGKEYERILKTLKKSFYSIYSEGYYLSEDPKLFFDKIKELALILEQKKIPYLGDLGTGIVYPFFKETENEKRAEIADFLKKIKIRISRHGYGLIRKYYLEESERKILQRVKLRHDPFGKLNKNKFISISKEKEIIEGHSEYKEAVKANLEEEKSAGEILDEFKTPEEKIEEFIKEETEKEVQEASQIKTLEEDKVKESNPIEVKIQEELKDYEQTFSSELPFERRVKIEEFAKGIPREISRKKEVKVNYDEIKNIMTNKYGFDLEKGNFEVNKNEEIDFGKINREGNIEKRGKITSEEEDIINKVMMNKFGGEKSSDEKKEEKK